jgi:hypothetical protein
MLHAMPPIRRAPSESAAMPPTDTSSGAPASRARYNVGASSGSSAITRQRLANHAAMPAMRPPPPTLTSTVSGAQPACNSISRASAPEPATTSGLIVRVRHQRTAFELARFAGGQRVGIDVARDHDLRIERGEPQALGG